MFINHSSKEVTAKIVYYGTGLSGKTTNLQYIFSITNPQSRGELISVETEIERTLFFDLLPINVGLIKGYFTKFQLYTVPGQIFYNSTRKMVLKGADGIVFVADSQEAMEQANIESLENLKENLKEDGNDLSDLPLVFQYNKRDLKNVLPSGRLNEKLNNRGLPYFEAVSTKGTGVVETLREISTLTLENIKKEIDLLDTKSGLRPVISFDINTAKEIIPKEDIPVKRIRTGPEEAEIAHEPSADFHSGDIKEEIIVLEEDLEPVREKPEKKKEKFVDNGNYSLLNTLRGDESRLTVINRIQASKKYTISVSDGNSKILKTIEISPNPAVRKINLILDVEK